MLLRALYEAYMGALSVVAYDHWLRHLYADADAVVDAAVRGATGLAERLYERARVVPTEADRPGVTLDGWRVQ